jgi:hypothetical protein
VVRWSGGGSDFVLGRSDVAAVMVQSGHVEKASCRNGHKNFLSMEMMVVMVDIGGGQN